MGEAKSAQLIGQAITNNPAFITPRKIEAAREIAHTISNSANKVFLTSDELLLNLQETNLGTSTGKKFFNRCFRLKMKKFCSDNMMATLMTEQFQTTQILPLLQL